MKKKLSLRLIEDLRSKVIDLEAWVSQSKARLTDTKFDMEKADANCEQCGSPMVVQKTVTRKIVTLVHNLFHARERVLVCRRGCKRPDGTYVTGRDQTLASLASPGSNYGYDVEVYVGIERFVRHRQREEIRAALMEQYAISISSSEVSVLARRFLMHLEGLHKHRADKIREAIRKDGGYTMHIDATTEGGRGTLLVILSGWSQWVLGAWKIPSESEKAIGPCITEICGLFGEPCAVVRDLGHPIASAVEKAAAKMTVRPKIFACHYHFLRDVGKGILYNDHDNLCKLARKLSVRTNIRSVIGALRRKVGHNAVAYAKQYFNDLSSCYGFPHIPQGICGHSLIIFLAQWALDFGHDSKNMTFPFGRPHYDLYKRCLVLNKAIDVFLAQERFDRTIDNALEKLRKAILPFVEDKGVRKTVREIEARMELFDKFRALFRLVPEMPGSASADWSQAWSAATVPANGKQAASFESFESGIQRQVDAFTAKLERRYDSISAKKDMDIKFALKVIVDHLKKHGKFLWGHLVALGDGDSVRYRMVDRTNNVLEGLFGRMKQRERRRSGRKILTKDFESIPPAAALAMNLSDPSYIEAVCGHLDSLPLWFSKIDRECKEKSGSAGNTIIGWFPVDEEAISMTDKMFVRKQKVQDWILAASQGRDIEELKAEKSSHVHIAPFQEIGALLEKSS